MGTLKASPTSGMKMNEEEQTHLKYASESNIDDAVDMTEPGLRRIAKFNDDFTSTEDSWSPSTGNWSQEDGQSSVISGHSFQLAGIEASGANVAGHPICGLHFQAVGSKSSTPSHKPPRDGNWSFAPGLRLPKHGHNSKSGHMMQSQEHIYDSIDYDAMDDYEDPDMELVASRDKTEEEDENIYEEPINMQSPDYLTLQSIDKVRDQIGAKAGNLMQHWLLKTRATISSTISDTSSDYLTLKCQSKPKPRKLPNLPKSGPPPGGFGTRLEEHESGFFSYPEPNQLYHWDPPIPPLAEEEELQQQHITSIPISSRRATHAQCGPQWVTVNGRRFARGVIGEQAPVPQPRRRRGSTEVSQKTVIPITGGLGSQNQDSRMKIQNSQSGDRFVQSLKMPGNKSGISSTRISRGSIQEETNQARTHDMESRSFRCRGA